MEQIEQISPAENRSSSWCQSKWHRGDFSSSMLLYKRVASTIDAPQSPVPTRPANHQLVNVLLWIVSAISANDAMGPWWDSVAPCYRIGTGKGFFGVSFDLNPWYSTQYIDLDFIVSEEGYEMISDIKLHQSHQPHPTFQAEYLVLSVASIDVPKSFSATSTLRWRIVSLVRCQQVQSKWMPGESNSITLVNLWNAVNQGLVLNHRHWYWRVDLWLSNDLFLSFGKTPVFQLDVSKFVVSFCCVIIFNANCLPPFQYA